MVILFTITTLLSSFLLFTIQLLVGKRILPWLGGSASIWTTAMLFFMFALFLGYLYVQRISGFSKTLQVKIHQSLIGISLISLIAGYLLNHSLINNSPILNTLPPVFHIILLIFINVGLPFILLSTTSTLLQFWYSNLYPKRSPYFLYITSNIGSLFGLLSYPFLIEPNLSISSQEIFWLVIFGIFTVLMAFIIHIFSRNRTEALSNRSKSKYFVSGSVGWLALSTISNVALLATTSEITQSVSPFPLLWIAPLAIFLISYIIAFSNAKWYSREFHLTVLLMSIIMVIIFKFGYFNYWTDLGMKLFSLFIINLICHTEIYLSRPKPKLLVPFYLAISLGGVLASILCAVIAPVFFKDLWEFPLSLILAIVMFLFFMSASVGSWYLKIQYIFLGLAVTSLITFQFSGLFSGANNNNTQILKKTRNFYGVLTLTESKYDNVVTTELLNGKITHGSQINNQFEPTTYYGRDSGVGVAIENNPKRISKKPMRYGVIGLGVGTMAAYCQPGDYFRFYEINPDVIELSKKYFTYISNCLEVGGAVDTVIGDARLSLEKERDSGILEKFDLIVVDAFTDDAIPIHLITTEAVNLYLEHLSEDGFIGFHISNSYLDLHKALEQITFAQDLYSFHHQSNSSVWYFVSTKPITKPFDFYRLIPENKMRPWTDDYSNIIQIIR